MHADGCHIDQTAQVPLIRRRPTRQGSRAPILRLTYPGLTHWMDRIYAVASQ
jgi:hypothetical protein